MSNVAAYLAKKRWNPGNIKNVEEVWKKEQAKKEEEKKIKELQKEYAEERNREALDELQVQAGVKKSSNRLSWMYETTGPIMNKQKETTADEFLLGEKSVDEVISKKKLKDSSNVSEVNTKDVVFSKSEQMLRNMDDPMALIINQRSLNRQNNFVEEKNKKKSKRHKKSKKNYKEEEDDDDQSSSSSSSSNSSREKERKQPRRKKEKKKHKKKKKHHHSIHDKEGKKIMSKKKEE